MKLIWHGLNDNYGHTKEEIKPQVDKYTLENNVDIIVLAEGRLSKLRLCNWTS